MLWQLFCSFLQVGLFSIGGGYAAMPLIRSEVVLHHGWLTMGEFTDLITIAEMTPGPIAVNSATFVGLRIAGIPGAVIATFGCIFPSLLIVSALAWIYQRYRKLSALQSVLASLRPAVTALIAAAGLSILKTVLFPGGEISLGQVNWVGAGLFLGAFVLIRHFRWNPIAAMCLCGGVNLLAGLLMGAV